MIFKLLDKLRTKPREVRQRVAFSTAVGFTLLVGGIWMMTLPARFVGNSDMANAEGTKPFAGLMDGFREQFGMLKNQAGLMVSSFGTTTASSTIETNGTSTGLIDLNELLASTTLDKPVEKAVPILIGTTTAVETTETEGE